MIRRRNFDKNVKSECLAEYTDLIRLVPYVPSNTRRWPSDGLALGQRRRRWASVCWLRVLGPAKTNSSIYLLEKQTVTVLHNAAAVSAYLVYKHLHTFLQSKSQHKYKK